MAEEWGVNIQLLATKIKAFIINAVSDGELKQTKGEYKPGFSTYLW